ncbi:MAG: aminotransferase class I/II-fold pyridoxal phosphate-dependent enzyme, partial [Candidatus Puniceispirillaceae bacterium]
MNSSSHRAAALQPSLIREVAESAMGRADVIGLWFGEGRWPTSEIAVSAAQNALAKGDHFYQPNSGKPALRASLQNYMNRLYGLALDISAITVTGSGMQAMMLAAQALTDPGDKIVVVGPAWPNLSESFKIAGGDIHIVSLQAVNGRWHLDMDRLLDSLTPDTKAVLVNSPNNPTGWVMDKADQLKLLFHCRKHGIWIISDDVYSRLYQFA